MSYLDGNGLATLWAKIKQYVRDNATSSIPDSSVTTSKLASGAVTVDKLSGDIFVTEERVVITNLTIGANGGSRQILSLAKDGYKPIAMLGWYIAGLNSTWCTIGEMNIRPNYDDVTLYIWNQYTGGSANITLGISVLYMKTS